MAALALVGLAMAGAAVAQTPAELPPPGFEGREYIDSSGCAFMRATVGGAVAWTPRLSPDRSPVCGLTPTLATAAPAAAALAAAPPPESPPRAAPPPAALPAAALPPVAADAKSVEAQMALSPRAPAPRAASPVRRAAPAAPPRAEGRGTTVWKVNRQGVITGVHAAPPLTPPGYAAAFDDGRLNPWRGPNGTGAAAAGLQPVAIDPTWVQIAAFPTAQVAERVGASLAAQGVPVRLGRFDDVRDPRRVLLAGPFADAAALERALATVRGAGYPGARIR